MYLKEAIRDTIKGVLVSHRHQHAQVYGYAANAHMILSLGLRGRTEDERCNQH